MPTRRDVCDREQFLLAYLIRVVDRLDTMVFGLRTVRALLRRMNEVYASGEIAALMEFWEGATCLVDAALEELYARSAERSIDRLRARGTPTHPTFVRSKNWKQVKRLLSEEAATGDKPHSILARDGLAAPDPHDVSRAEIERLVRTDLGRLLRDYYRALLKSIRGSSSHEGE